MPSSKRGSALLTVLWLTAALSAIGLAVANNVRSETERATTNVDDVKAYFIARGAIERAALRMRWGIDYYRSGNPVMELPFPNAEVRVGQRWHAERHLPVLVGEDDLAITANVLYIYRGVRTVNDQKFAVLNLTAQIPGGQTVLRVQANRGRRLPGENRSVAGEDRR